MELTVQDVAGLLNKGKINHFIDVREPEEHAICAIESAHLIPLKTLPDHIDTFEPHQKIVFFCHAGIRSLHAVRFMRAQGYGETYSMHGGIDAWSCEIDPAVPRY